MGLLSHIISFAIGTYAGVYACQNYELPPVPSTTELSAKIENYLKQYKKD